MYVLYRIVCLQHLARQVLVSDEGNQRWWDLCLGVDPSSVMVNIGAGEFGLMTPEMSIGLVRKGPRIR